MLYNKFLYNLVLSALSTHSLESTAIELWNIYQDQTGTRQIYEANSDEIMERFDSFRHFLETCNGVTCGKFILSDKYFSLVDGKCFTFSSIGVSVSPYDAAELATWLLGDQEVVNLYDWLPDLPKYVPIERSVLCNMITRGDLDKFTCTAHPPSWNSGEILNYAESVLGWWGNIVTVLTNYGFITVQKTDAGTHYFLRSDVNAK
jgi:hypothetical protein